MAEHFGVETLLGDAVTRSAIHKAIVGADIIHFAGHAEFNPKAALESGVHLSGEGTLTAHDIFKLEGMHAHLVTLSGCETGVNENRS